jgi:hypothetical protein
MEQEPSLIQAQAGGDGASIIIRILFAVTLFQHSPLTRRVFYNSIRRERGHHHQQHQVSERTTSSTTSWNTDWHIYKSSESFSHQQHRHSQWNEIIICINMD